MKKLSETSLSIRAINCLRALEILTVEDLKDYVSQESVESLLKYNHIGKKTLNEVRKFIESNSVNKCCANCLQYKNCELVTQMSSRININSFYCSLFDKNE